MKHYFYLVVNTRTHESHYYHDFYKDVAALKSDLPWYLELIKVWEVKGEVEL